MTAPQIKEIERPSYEAVAGKIAEFIKRQGLRPGDRLPTERELSTRLEVSRAVVRDAVKILGAAGLVQPRHGSGVYVTGEPQPFASATIDISMPIDPEHITNLYRFRRTIEAEAAEIAADQITLKELRALEQAEALHRSGAVELDSQRFREGDIAFHQGIADSTKNPFFRSAVASTLKLQNWAVDISLSRTPGSLIAAADEHEAILEAIREGNAPNARQAMKTHLESAFNNYLLEVRRRLNAAS